MKRSVSMSVGLLLLGLTAITPVDRTEAQESPEIAEGPGKMLLQDTRVGQSRPLRVWYYRPRGFAPDSRILFVMHGLGRNADGYRDAWIPHAEKYTVLLIVPEFSRLHFPDDEQYNLGNMIAKDGRPVPREEWSFAVIDRVFAHVRDATKTNRKTYSIFGHSAGAQFVHRLLTFTKTIQVEMAVAANAGWYTLPLFSEPFPYGLGGTSLAETDLRENFAKRLVILLGDADTNPNNKDLRRTSEAMRQGKHRFARGQHYFRVSEAEAKRLGADFAWRLATAPGVGHSNKQMSEHAARVMFR